MLSQGSRCDGAASRGGDRRFCWLAFAGCALVLSAFGLLRVHWSILDGYDLGIFDQAVWHYAHFQAPIVTLKGDGFNIWGDHFHPIIAAWAPLYWIWDDVRMLIIGQALVVAAAVFPVHHFLARRLDAWVRVLTVLAVVGWPVLTLAAYDVHEIAFAVPLLAWAVDALDRRRDVQVAVACALLLLVREDMGALVFMIGLVRVAWAPGRAPGEHRTRRDAVMGAALMVVGLAVFALVTTVVIPHFAAQGYQYWDYPQLGSGPKGALLGVLKAPWHAIGLLFWPPMKLGTWALLLVPLALLPLRSPYALIGLPIMLERMLSARENLWTPMYQYNAPVWIVVVLAGVAGYGSLSPRWKQRLAPRRLVLLVVAVVLDVGVAVALLVNAGQLARGGDDRAAAAAWVPADTCVLTDNRMAAAFTHTNRVSVPGFTQHRQDFVVLDWAPLQTAPLPGGLDTAAVSRQIVADGFHQVARFGDVAIWQAPDYAGPDASACGPAAS